MPNTFTKTSLRGFTLIELLVVIAIIGLLSTAIMGPVQTGLKKGRDTRKISDIAQVQGALLQYAGDNNGKYPATLGALSPTYMSIDNKFGGASSTVATRDLIMYVTYTDTASNTVMYHMGTALENQNASLQTDVDCADNSVSTTGVIDDTVPFSSASSTPACSNGLSGGILTNTNSMAYQPGNPILPAANLRLDFGGRGLQEAATGVCTSKLDTCIFDVIPK